MKRIEAPEMFVFPFVKFLLFVETPPLQNNTKKKAPLSVKPTTR